jgi:hypothetical protein
VTPGEGITRAKSGRVGAGALAGAGDASGFSPAGLGVAGTSGAVFTGVSLVSGARIGFASVCGAPARASTVLGVTDGSGAIFGGVAFGAMLSTGFEGASCAASGVRGDKLAWAKAGR